MRADGGAFILTPGGVLVPKRTLFTSAAASPWNAIVTGPGVLKQLNLRQTSTLNGVLKIFDALNTLGTALVQFNPGASDAGLFSTSRLFNLPFVNGLSVSYSQPISFLSIATVGVDDTPRHLFQSAAAPPWNAIATGKGVLKGIAVQSTSTVTQVFDGLTTAGTMIFEHDESSNGFIWVDADAPFTTGLTITNSGLPTLVTAVYTLG